MASERRRGLSVHTSAPFFAESRETTLFRKAKKFEDFDLIDTDTDETPVRSSRSDPNSSSSYQLKSTSPLTSENPDAVEIEEFEGYTLRVKSIPNLILLQNESIKSLDNVLDEKKMRKIYPTLPTREMYYVNLQGQHFSKIEKSILHSWRKVVGIDAGENNFQIEIFQVCPLLEELVIPLNGIKNINIHYTQFQKLKVLDLTCNSVTPTAIYTLGQLINLKILDLSSNNIKNIPSGINSKSYPQLQVLILDYNFISRPATFKILSRLRKLKTLSLIDNKVWCLPFIETKGTNSKIQQQMKKLMLDDVRRIKEDQDVQDVSPLVVKSKPESDKSSETIKKKQMTLYIKDEKNDGLPFPRLHQLDLQNNKISQVEYVLAIKTWEELDELVLTGNRILNVSSRFLSGIRNYLVPHINLHLTRFSCRINDPNTDPFQSRRMAKKLIAINYKLNCHHLKLEKQGDSVQFNLDVSRSTPSGISSLPLPHQRLCTFLHVPATVLEKHKLPPKCLSQLTPSKAQISDLCETILRYVAPTTLPSTILATKVALHRVLKRMDVKMLGNFVLKEEKEAVVEENEDVLFGKLFRHFLSKKLNCK